MILPEFFENYFRALMNPDEYEQFKASFDSERHFGLRLNTLKVERASFKKLTQMRLSEIPWVSEGFYYEEGDAPGKHPYYHAGLYYIQEPSAMMPAKVLAPQPGERVLDLCAAPGGKTTHIGTQMENKGFIVTNDISPKRVKALTKNVELMGLTNTLVVNETPQRLRAVFPEFFDRILLDVPCSGEGMFKKDKEAVQSYTGSRSAEFVAIQREIFQEAYEMLRPGGILVYSTCTFNPDENERNIEDFLQRYDLTVKAIEPRWGWSPSMREWTQSKNEALFGGLRLWPHRAKGEGHFVCQLQKAGSSSKTQFQLNDQDAFESLDAEKAAMAFFEFSQENMYTRLHGTYHMRGSSLYLLPSGLETIPRIRWEIAGLHVGDYQKGRFEPSQSLIMSSNGEHFKRVVNFIAGDQQVIRYLKGETLMLEGEKGFTAICVDGFPLGWAKQENGMLKNLYCKGWRMM